MRLSANTNTTGDKFFGDDQGWFTFSGTFTSPLVGEIFRRDFQESGRTDVAEQFPELVRCYSITNLKLANE